MITLWIIFLSLAALDGLIWFVYISMKIYDRYEARKHCRQEEEWLKGEN